MAGTQDLKTATRTVVRDETKPAREISADICIAGAGISGISAALEAARLGRHTVLIDALPALGGQAVNSIIGNFCGLFSNGAAGGYQLTHGIADDLLRDLGREGALHYRLGPMTTVIMYDEKALCRWCEKALRAAGVTVILNAVLRGVRLEGRRIRTVALATPYGDLCLGATGFVDATGNAALAWQAGLPCREPADGPVYGTHMMVLEEIDQASLPTQQDLSARLREKAHAYGLVRTDGFTFAFPPTGTALVNLTHTETPLDPVAATVHELAGKDQADRVLPFLRSEFPGAFARARVRAYGLIGLRQTRWIVGRRQLTVDDVRAGTRFADAVARTAWPIELHDRVQGYIWEPFPDEHIHYVPFASLTPPGVDNLVAAGRCIDGDTAALSSVRVMGPCIATGAAAAHALDLAGGGNVHQIDVSLLQDRLKGNLVRTD